MKLTLYLVTLSVLFGHVGLQVIRAQSPIRNDITICQLRVPSSIKQARADFIVSYSFKLDKNGVPMDLLKIKDDYVGTSEVLSCVVDWRFTGYKEGAQFTTLLKWKHGKGWVEVFVLGPNLSHAIKIREGIGY